MSSLWVYTQTVESYPPLPSEYPSVVVCPRFALGRLISALRAAARRVSAAEAVSGLFTAAAARERVCMVLDIMNLFSELV